MTVQGWVKMVRNIYAMLCNFRIRVYHLGYLMRSDCNVGRHGWTRSWSGMRVSTGVWMCFM